MQNDDLSQPRYSSHFRINFSCYRRVHNGLFLITHMMDLRTGGAELDLGMPWYLELYIKTALRLSVRGI